MPKLLELVLLCFTQLVALFGILIGITFVPQLARAVLSMSSGQPWQGPELARLVACTCGPILFGVLLSSALFWQVRTSYQLRKRMTAFPDQPWLWRADWEAKRIRLSNSAAIGFLVTATTTYLLAVLPLGIYLASLKNAGMVYAFLAVPACFLLLFVRLQWINRHRNRSVLHLETLPGQIKGRFSGLATIPVSFPKGTTYKVALRCEETLSSHTNSGNSGDLVSLLTNTQNSRSRGESRTSTVYDDATFVTPSDNQLTPRCTCLDVTFEIPDGLPSTGTIAEAAGPESNTRVTRYYRWCIRIRLSSESDLREIVFEVPVFDAAKSCR